MGLGYQSCESRGFGGIWGIHPHKPGEVILWGIHPHKRRGDALGYHPHKRGRVSAPPLNMIGFRVLLPTSIGTQGHLFEAILHSFIPKIYTYLKLFYVMLQFTDYNFYL